MDTVEVVTAAVLHEKQQRWACETKTRWEEQREANLTLSVRGMAKKLNAEEAQVRKWHCLRCCTEFDSAQAVRCHLRALPTPTDRNAECRCEPCNKTFPRYRALRNHRRRRHCYGQKILKKEIRRVRAVLTDPGEATAESMLLLRIGFALKIATLVRLRGMAEAVVDELLGDL